MGRSGISSRGVGRGATGPDLRPYGYGATTVGGRGQSIVTVSSLSSGSGAGTLRNALSGGVGNRRVVFSVGGTIPISGNLLVGGSNITIAGSTAPAPGITLTGDTLSFETDSGGTAHDIIVENIRHRGGGSLDTDAFQVTEGAHDILFHQCSSSDAEDGLLDVTDGAFNVTAQWCIFSKPNPGSGSDGAILIKYNGAGLTSWHHNIWYDIIERGPLVAVDDSAASTGTQLIADKVNDIHYQWTNSCSSAYDGGWMNVRNCFYQSSSNPGSAVVPHIFGGGPNDKIYTHGNFSGNGTNVDSLGTESSLIGSPAYVPIYPVSQAFSYVLAHAGCRTGGLDSYDQAIVTDILANAVRP